MTSFSHGRGASLAALGLAALLSGTISGTDTAQSQTMVQTQATAPSAASGTRVADPGPRGGAPAAGGPLSGLGADEQSFFAGAKKRFQEIDSVSGKISGEPGVGLGPRFNLNGCAGCHAFPTAGGTSPTTNPQVAVATLHGAHNSLPSFITASGPVREARFIHNPDGSPDGGVHDLFVITGRSDAPGCAITQPDFAAAQAQNNIIFRIPTPVFGMGLVESVPDASLEDAAADLEGVKSALGISGEFNRSGNDGTITRFGWKAQNKSLLIFAGEAYNVEQGVTNEAFPNEREDNVNCQFNGTPEDSTNMTNTFNSGSTASDYSSDVVNFAAFARLSAPPAPVAETPVTATGRQAFVNIGCDACHVMTQTTGRSAYTAQSNVSFHPFSDFALHQMGRGLADNVSQGNAAGNEFRTAPLWGVGQRLFFLHDGRTSDLVAAIEAHASDGSEANHVIENFEMLSPTDKQALLDYLRSL